MYSSGDALEAAAVGIAGRGVPMAVAGREGKRLPAMRPAIDDVVGVQPHRAVLDLRRFRAGPERSQAVREGTLRVEVVLPVAVIESRGVPAQIGPRPYSALRGTGSAEPRAR